MNIILKYMVITSSANTKAAMPLLLFLYWKKSLIFIIKFLLQCLA
nr:MAG TPA: hypothetical protein [Caudoviricetes sp.]